jgi:hypothetical protein
VLEKASGSNLRRLISRGRRAAVKIKREHRSDEEVEERRKRGLSVFNRFHSCRDIESTVTLESIDSDAVVGDKESRGVIRRREEVRRAYVEDSKSGGRKI